ncbi:MAG: adenylate cyclase, partial [Solirubrobacteraceae bacterium]|nr:adenylate cyclase [Solirubrobacteraceae bacterium]
MDERPASAAQVALEVGTTPSTLRRWLARGLIPQYDGSWTPAAVTNARLVARMRERGHSLDQIRAAGESGRLAFGYLSQLFPATVVTHTLEQAAQDTGLEPAL